MLEKLMVQLEQLRRIGHAQEIGQPDLYDNREHLYGLLCFIQKDITRWEQIFNLAAEEALVDHSIYMLKSLRAQQQFLVQNIRRLEGVGQRTEETVPTTQDSIREGFALG